MKTIISDNVEIECQNMITAFLDVEFIKNKIVEVYPNISVAKQKQFQKIFDSISIKGWNWML